MSVPRPWLPVCALFLCAGAKTPEFPKPPEVFIDHGTCPGECCTYGPWRAKEAVDLHEAPTQAARIVGRVRAGAHVEALTGKVHTKAGKFVVDEAFPPYRAGDVIWVYTYRGEGYYKVWRAGEMVLLQGLPVVMPGYETPTSGGHYERTPVSHWWIRVEEKGGLVGWTNEPSKFSGTYSCGE